MLSSNINSIDVDECMGEQDFSADPDLSDDPDYYELLNVILSTCYNKSIELESYILTGNAEGAGKAGDEIVIECSCEECRFHKRYRWSEPYIFEDEKDKAFDLMKKVVEDKGALFVEIPEMVRADHHCLLQPKMIQNYKDLTAKNKSVLSMLRYFGLYKIILADFHEDSSYTAGTIMVDRVVCGKESEIVEGWLFCQTGFKSKIKLYFPKNIGKALCTFAENRFEYERIEKLKTQMCV